MTYLGARAFNVVATYMKTSGRYIVDEEDFSFEKPNKKECCYLYDFKKNIRKKEDILKHEVKTNELFCKGWEKAAKMAEQLSKNELLSVVTYTLEDPPVYKDFNKQVRRFNVDDHNFEYKGMHFLLHSAINKLSAYGGPYHVYRGVTHKIRAKEGEKFHFNSFASASQDLNVARSFGTQSRSGYTGREYKCITIFDISNTNKGGYIGNYSKFSESEVVIPPCEEFKVVKIEKELKPYQIDGEKRN